jgi:hypothetical protein
MTLPKTPVASHQPTLPHIVLCDRVGSRLLSILLTLFNLVRQNTGILARALVDLTLVPCPLALGLELVTAGTELGNGLLSKELF